MTISWRDQGIAPLDAYIQGEESETRRAMAGFLRNRVQEFGLNYQRYFPEGSGRPSVLEESADHLAWRTEAMPTALSDLDTIAASIDGEAATPVDDESAETLREAQGVIVARLEAIAQGDDEREANLARYALESIRIPPRPRYYVRGHYEFKAWGPRPLSRREKIQRRYLESQGLLKPEPPPPPPPHWVFGTAGEAEKALRDALDAVSEFLALL